MESLKAVLCLSLLLNVNAKEDIICAGKSGCECDLINHAEYICKINGKPITLDAQINKYFSVNCQNQDVDYDQFPQFKLLNSVEKVKFKSCPLPATSFGEVLINLNIIDTQKLNIENPLHLSMHLEGHHFKRLNSISTLFLVDNYLGGDIINDLFHELNNLSWLDLQSRNVSLSNDTFKSLPLLRTLDLSVPFAVIPQGLFKNLPELKKLSIKRSEILSLSRDSFFENKNMQDIYLRFNNLSNIPEGIFQTLTQLQNCTISGDGYRELPNDLFKFNKNLERLAVLDNKQLNYLPPNLLSELPLLNIVQMSRCNFTSLSSHLFTNSTSITHLQLDNNALEILPRDIFRDQGDLVYLDLSYNKISTLYPDTFSHLNNLQILSLRNNKISSLSSLVFSSLHNLNQLFLEFNNLKSISLDAFGKITKLLELNMAYNMIEFDSEENTTGYTCTSPFRFLENLSSLNLSKNHMSAVCDDWKSNLQSLKYLDLSHNRIRNLSVSHLNFQSLDTLIVDVRSNQIRMIDIFKEDNRTMSNLRDANTVTVLVESNPFECDCLMFPLLYSIKMEQQLPVNLVISSAECAAPATLNGTQLLHVPLNQLVCSLENVNNLVCPTNCDCEIRPSDSTLVVSCKNNNGSLPAIPDPALIGLNKTEFRLENSELTEFPQNIFPRHLTYLYLHGNQITTLKVRDIPSSVQLLDLSANKIDHVDSDVAQQILGSQMLQQIYLAGNPISCNCNNEEFLHQLQLNSRKVDSYLELSCTNGTRIAHIRPGQLCTGAHILTVALSVFTALLALLFLVTAICYRYRQQIEVFLFSKGLCLRFISQRESDDSKRYDAFVSFSYLDDQFVAQFVRELESGPDPYNICIHYRDWIPGRPIPRQIVDSVRDSKRTIVVLSPNFLESVWGKTEFRIASVQETKEKAPRVIVVLYGDVVSEKDLDPELKAYLSTHTYIKWGDPWFWEKLRYAMPHKKSRPIELQSAQITARNGFQDRIEAISGNVNVDLPPVQSHI